MKGSFYPRSYFLCILSVIALVAAVRSWSADVLVPAGSVWKYLDNGIDQGTAWVSPSFNDNSWPSGPAQLGYGDGDEATVVAQFNSTNQNVTNITHYFRRSFVVTNSASITGLTVRLLRDDGGVVYLNGVEVFRSNMPTGAIAVTTLALTSASGADETTNFHAAPVPPNLLVAGANTLAVEIHQATPANSDMSFDLELLASSGPPVPPTIVTQPQSQTVTQGANVTFNVVVSGTPPLEYGWRFNGSFIPGATNSSLTLLNVQPSSAERPAL